MTPAPMSSRPSERIPLSPVKVLTTSAPQVPFFEVPPFPGVPDKENVQGSSSNFQIYEDQTSSKPILITLDGEEPKPAPPKKSSLGRPPKLCSDAQQKPAPKVRLCSELARDGIIPAGIVMLMACILAASHADEDHSYSTIKSAIGSAIEDLHDGESWLSWLVIVSVLLFIGLGLICAYICSNSASSAPKKPTSQKSILREDTSSHSLTRRRAGSASYVS